MRLRMFVFVMLVGMNILFATLYYFMLRPLDLSGAADVNYHEFRFNVPGEPVIRNDLEKVKWQIRSYRYEINTLFTQQDHIILEDYADYQFNLNTKYNSAVIFIDKVNKNISIFCIIEYEPGKYFYLRQKSNSTSLENLDVFFFILDSMQYKGEKVFNKDDFKDVYSGIPKTYMQSQEFFKYFMFGPFNVIFLIMLISFMFSGKKPGDILSFGIIPIYEGKADVYYKTTVSSKGHVAYIAISSEEILIFIFGKLKQRIPYRSSDYSVKREGKYIRIQKLKEDEEEKPSGISFTKEGDYLTVKQTPEAEKEGTNYVIHEWGQALNVKQPKRKQWILIRPYDEIWDILQLPADNQK
ncbi:MAG: hypothetical protein PHV06_04950 [bacterium]|nr:hypothetical protein [bacterium]